jgi:endonuclease YncB( thermonuclease family)
MTNATTILENMLTSQEHEIALYAIELVESQKALKATNPYNASAMAESRKAVDSASARLGMAYDRLISIRQTLLTAKADA